MGKKKFFERWNMTDHGDKPKLLEYDPKNDIVDIFIYRDPNCPYPYTITNTRDDSDIWKHQGFYLKNFIIYLKDFFERNNLPYKVKKIEEIDL
jgi:hypothetical protein